MTVTVTLNSSSYKIEDGSMNDDSETVATDWDAWGASGYEYRHKAYGKKRRWTFTISEKVAWSSSIGQYLHAREVDGAAFSLEITDSNNMIVVSPAVQVYCLSCSIRYSVAEKIRFVTSVLQEA